MAGDHAAAARARLEAAAAGLLFVSESEAPLEYVEATLPAGAAAATRAATVARAFGERGAVRESSVAAFFAGHLGDADPADPVQQSLVPRFRALVTAIEEELRAPRVYCFGEVEKRCYVVGEAGGVLAGVRTVVFET